jgi:hypothetical protein
MMDEVQGAISFEGANNRAQVAFEPGHGTTREMFASWTAGGHRPRLQMQSKRDLFAIVARLWTSSMHPS